MNPRRRLRVLLLAEQCNPEWPSLPVVGYKYALALAEFCDVVVVTQIRNRENIRRHVPSDSRSLQFSFIDTEYVAAPMHRIAAALRGNAEVAWSTGVAMSYLPYIEFERRTWRRFHEALSANKFDIVHRITPMSPTLPSWMAGRASQPFVIGPLNGNLAWPAAFVTEQKREKERLRRLRDFYKFLPYSRRTWRHSDLVLAAFQHTVDDLDAVPARRIEMFPEVGYDESIFFPPPAHDSEAEASHSGTVVGAEKPVTFLFVGRLVPYKLAEVAIRAFLSSSLPSSGHRLRIVGDGPERERLERLVDASGAAGSVAFEGRLTQAKVAQSMQESDVFVFPSIRELGAGVVVEAMACGLLCIVVDYGGPADLISPDRGRKVPMAPLEDLITTFRSEMVASAAAYGQPEQLRIRQAAADYVFDNFRWARKAEFTNELYERLVNHAPVVH